MKILEARIRVPTDDGVTAEMLQRIMKNQMHFLTALYELPDGQVHWERAGVRVTEELNDQCS